MAFSGNSEDRSSKNKNTPSKKKKNHRNTHLSLIRIFFLFKPPGTHISLQISLKPFRRVFIAFLHWAQLQIWFPLVTKCKLWFPQMSLSDRLYPCEHSDLASELSPCSQDNVYHQRLWLSTFLSSPPFLSRSWVFILSPSIPPISFHPTVPTPEMCTCLITTPDSPSRPPN